MREIDALVRLDLFGNDRARSPQLVNVFGCGDRPLGFFQTESVTKWWESVFFRLESRTTISEPNGGAVVGPWRVTQHLKP